jgi:hypothetical protein
MTDVVQAHVPALVDPWAMQRTLMAASSQHLPSSPELNKGVVLYAALNLEEGQETLVGLHKALHRITGAVAADARSEDMKRLHDIANLLTETAALMKRASKDIRNTLGGVSNDFRFELEEAEVVEMTDGTTDLTVTNSGFALALGLDGGACYDEVAGSNLSKRDDNGIIQKHPDGKWIKDPKNYREPNLRAVIWPEKYGAGAAVCR